MLKLSSINKLIWKKIWKIIFGIDNHFSVALSCCINKGIQGYSYFKIYFVNIFIIFVSF